jgi:hypothetical protein
MITNETGEYSTYLSFCIASTSMLLVSFTIPFVSFVVAISGVEVLLAFSVDDVLSETEIIQTGIINNTG